MPPVKNDYDTSMATAAYDLAVKWHTADVMGIGAEPPNGVSPDDIKGWGSDQVGKRHTSRVTSTRATNLHNEPKHGSFQKRTLNCSV